MRTNRWLSNTSWGLSFLLCQASIVLGLMLSLGWSLAFAFILEQKSGPRLFLPIEPPLIGLSLGVVGYVMAQAHPSLTKYAIAGLIFNALPLALAIVLFLSGRVP